LQSTPHQHGQGQPRLEPKALDSRNMPADKRL
jgi:hypothetical protein